MPWILRIDKKVLKELDKIPTSEARRINDAIKNMDSDPYSGDIEKMRGQANVWRRRIGNYRIFYEIYPALKTVYVYHVERRTSKTY